MAYARRSAWLVAKLLLFAGLLAAIFEIVITIWLASAYPEPGIAFGAFIAICAVVILPGGIIAISLHNDRRPGTQVPRRRCRAFIGIGCALLAGAICTDVSRRTSVYTIEELRLKESEPPLVDIAGEWAGQWDNPKTGRSEKIVMKLWHENGNLKGAILTRRNDFGIAEAKVSGTRVYILYVLVPGWHGISGTLLGEATSDEIEGTWYANGKTWDGPWHVRRMQVDPGAEAGQDLPGIGRPRPDYWKDVD